MKYIREHKNAVWPRVISSYELMEETRGGVGWGVVKLKKKKILLASLNIASILFLLICYPDMHLK